MGVRITDVAVSALPRAEICEDLHKLCGSQRLQNLRVARRSGRGGAVVVASPPVARWWPVGGPDRPNDFSLNFKKCSGRQLLGGTVVLKARPSCSGPLRYAREPRRGRARPGVAWGGRWSRQVLWCAQYQGACTRASPVRALTPPSLMALPFCAESGEPWQIW